MSELVPQDGRKQPEVPQISEHVRQGLVRCVASPAGNMHRQQSVPGFVAPATAIGRHAEDEGMDARAAAEPPGPSQPWIARPLFRFDAWLRRRNCVFEDTSHPQCIFRMQVVNLGHEVTLGDGTRLRPGDRIIDLHIWNEQFPRFPADGATLSWALKIRSRIHISLAQLARHLATAPALADIMAIRADTRLAGTAMTAQLLRICRRYGFEPGPRLGPSSLHERLRRFGENILISLFVLARNARALRRDSIWRGRVEIFLSRRVLEGRYGLWESVLEPLAPLSGEPISVPESIEASPSLTPDLCSPLPPATQGGLSGRRA